MTLEGRAAIVTGGVGGIGSAIAHVLAEDGAQVVCVDRNEEALEDGAEKAQRWVGDPSRCIEGQALDIGDPEAVADAVTDVVRRHGRIDLLVNSAGISGPVRPIWETPVDHWHDNVPGTHPRHLLVHARHDPAHDRARLRPHREHR